MQRADYQGEIGKLIPVSQKEARSVCWTVYGDVGPVTMEGANLEPFSHIWNGSYPCSTISNRSVPRYGRLRSSEEEGEVK
jgi:hypothetical protein